MPTNSITTTSSTGSPSAYFFNKPVDHTESSLYYCESCDKEFNTKGSYDAHCANHEQCRHPDCTFSGTKRVVIAHYHSKHGQFSGTGYKVIEVEGQKFRVLLGTSPEEVEQWREERRKKFPTAANTEKKNDIEASVLKAGGILRNKRKPNFQSDKDTKRRKEVKTDDAGDDAGDDDAQVGDGIGQHEADIQTDDNGNAVQLRGKIIFINATFIITIIILSVCPYFVSGHCRRGKKCKLLHDKKAKREHKKKSHTNDDDANTKENQKGKGKLYLPKPYAGGEKGTLLKKLLEDEIFLEESLVLQCIQYIVNNNFFD